MLLKLFFENIFFEIKEFRRFFYFLYMEMMETILTPKNAKKYWCSICNFECSKKSDHDRHLMTRKHKNGNPMETLETIIDLQKTPKTPKTPNVVSCKFCFKEYKNKSGLWKHNKKCFEKKEEEKEEEKFETESKKEEEPKKDNDLIMLLLKENQEFKQLIIEQNKQNTAMQKQMLELAKKPVSVTNTNCNNRFNLNLFLNEKCKDAMNITDFVNSLKLTLQDLEKTAELGYVKGLTNIIVNGLNELDICKRPIHCSDLKRETIYIKDNDAWEKENEDKKKLTRAIKHISIRNAKQVGQWTKENKGYDDSSSKKSDKYLKIVSEANGGEPEEINKIISNISSKVTIDKQI